MERYQNKQRMRREIQTKQLEDDLERMYDVLEEKLGKADTDQLRKAHRQLLEIREYTTFSKWSN